VLLDHAVALALGGVRVDPESLDPEVLANRPPDSLFAERIQPFELIDMSGRVADTGEGT
jgi:hypothetical protein